MKTLLKIPFSVWVTITFFAFISIAFIIFILLFKVEQAIDVKLTNLTGNEYTVSNQVIEKLHLHDHLTIKSNNKFYHVVIYGIKNGQINLRGFKASPAPGIMYSAKFILGYTHIYSLLFGSV